MSNIALYIKMIEAAIPTVLPELRERLEYENEMLSYSLEGGGKRIRPLLCLEFAKAAGGNVENALPFALAVEFIHTYSLIHDDLPCMDNDDYRRGKLSSHKKFGEANALLAGDALLTRSFGIIAEAANGGVKPEYCIKAVEELSRLAGANGMIGGQYIDLYYENKEADGEILFLMDLLKTSALIESACVLGLISAGADDEKINAARNFAQALGLAFQIKDDILETKSNEPSSDEINNKATYVSVFGTEKAESLAEEYTLKAVKALDVFGDEASEIKEIADMLLRREK